MSSFGRSVLTMLFLLPWVPVRADEVDPEPPASAKVELKRLEGTYTVVSFERDGAAFPAQSLTTMKVIIKNGEGNFHQGDQLFTSTMTVFPNKKPKEVDSLYTNGFVKGSTVKGIYKVEKGRLICCYGPPNGGRPKDFTSPAGSNYTLYVLERVKK